MPNVIKQGVGVDYRMEKGNKDAITIGLNKLVKAGTIVYINKSQLPNECDDHSNDAVAMLVTKFNDLVANWSF